MNQLHSLSLFTPEDLRKAEENGEFDADANILNLRPDPVHFVRYLKSMDRPDVTGDIFVRLLEAYQQSKAASEQDPMRCILSSTLSDRFLNLVFLGVCFTFRLSCKYRTSWLQTVPQQIF